MRKKRSFYLFLTVVLIICLSQAIRGVYLNTSKYIILNQQLDKLGSLNNLAREKNLELRKQLKNYTSSKGIEALARDNLNMVGKDEVLVLIKESPKFPQKNKPAIKQAISN